MCPRSITWVLFDSDGRFQASLFLHTTFVCLWCSWRIDCVAAWHPKKNRTMLGDIGPRHIESELCGCNKTFRVIAWNLCTFRVIAWNLYGLPENGPSRCAWNTLVRQGGVLCYSIQTGTRISNHCWKLCHGFLIVFCAMRKITFIRSASGREQTTGRWHWLGSHLCTCVDTHFGPKPGAVDWG